MDTSTLRMGRIAVSGVSPVVEGGRWPAKAVTGETVPFGATVFREGHDLAAATLVLRRPDGSPGASVRMAKDPSGTPDHWLAQAQVDTLGSWTFLVEGWADPYGTWRHAVLAKVDAGQELGVELEEGARILERALDAVPATARPAVQAAVEALRNEKLDLHDRLAPAVTGPVPEALDAYPVRDFVTPSPTYRLWVDRPRALYGSWYEMFPRSEGAVVRPGEPPRSGTFRTAAGRLPAIAELGFDVVYLPPIHPIGHTWRKGPNNTLSASPTDPGVPWAIGSEHGGHDAVHPDLGTIEDFDAFVARARELGMEVALDLALQASPDHPWVHEHPEWFTVRPDGTVAYAENPPKKYQDIYPINFDRDPDGIYAEVLRVVRHWMSHGVRIFRVDNPHTKPLRFWEWLLAEVHRTDPDVIFLSEAFTRPPMMHALAMLGFQQSYTYFTWRNTKQELHDYLHELATPPGVDYMRPNLFVNTPDILSSYLQHGGPPAFKIRAVLAALAAPSWGVYSGYELCERTPLRPGSEEYLHSEKYELRPRDWARAAREGHTIAPYLRLLNEFRRAHPATHWLRNLRFHPTDGEHILCFSKTAGTGDDADRVIVVVNLDPHAAHEDIVHLDMPELGLSWWDRLTVHDAVTGATWEWGDHNYVRLDPFHEPAHVFTARVAW